MTVLVVYATHSGATRTLADTIARTLREECVEVALIDIEDGPEPSAFDAVVLGSAVRVESFEKSAVAWMDKHWSTIAERPFALFSCSGSASDPAKGGRQKATDVFLSRIRCTPVAVKNFPGWVIMGKIPLHERVLLKSLRTPTGDFRDLPAVAAWAREIAPLLRR